MIETARPPHLSYRPEIDGLRAIAVLSVVLYHFGIPGVKGGFVGVDIFFVISGFLIGGLLWLELQKRDAVDLVGFYLRRVRRIAPAFFAMAGVSAVFAAMVLLPFEFREFGKELVASTLWISNIIFYRGSGYFDIGADSKVLLHTWSLSVEEQFYVILPILIYILRFNRPVLLGVLIISWLTSFGACIALTPNNSTATFFLFPFRAWELLSGVLLAIWGIEQKSTWSFGLLPSLFGIALITVSIAFVDQHSGFPGWQAMLPVAGTLLLLLNGRHTNTVNRLLESRVSRFIGLISYSLYLWHWPVVTLSRYWRDGYADWAEVAAWMALAFILSVLSWRFIEQPCRRPATFGTRPLVATAAIAGLSTLVFGSLAYFNNGLSGRFSPQIQALTAASSDFLQDWSRCHVPTSGPFASISVCPIGPEGPPRVIFWGDSHLRAMREGLALMAQRTDTPGLIIWRGGCPPLLGISKRESALTPAEDAECLAQNRQLRTVLADLNGADTIVLIGRWAYYAEGAGTGRDAHNKIVLSALDDEYTGDTQDVLYANAWDATAAELSQNFARIFVMRQVPEIPYFDSRELARRLAHRHLTLTQANTLLHVPKDEVEKRVRTAEAPLFALAYAGKVKLIDTWPKICTDICTVMHNGKSWYFDNNHMTNTGARALAGLFEPVFGH